MKKLPVKKPSPWVEFRLMVRPNSPLTISALRKRLEDVLTRYHRAAGITKAKLVRPYKTRA